MFSETLSNKSLAFTFKTSEITLDVILCALNKLLQEKTKEKRGKQTLKDLRKKGILEVIEVTDQTLKKLNKYLKKYKLDYSILKNKTEEKQYTLFFRTYDAEILNTVMNQFLQEKFKNKESIRDKINKIKHKNIEQTQDKKIEQEKKRKEVML